MSSYRRYVAEHGAAIYRAKRQVRRHALETPPAWPNMHQRGGEKWAEETFQDFARKLKENPFDLTVPVQDVPDHILDVIFGTEPYGICPDCRGPKMAPGLIHQCPADPVLAYRGQRSGALCCPGCAGEWVWVGIPLTSDDLPDGGICAGCGVDVLIPVVPNPQCSLCKHAPHGGEAGCHCGCRGTR